MSRLLFLVEATPLPRRPEWTHGGPSRMVKGELAWSCGNTLCGECVALQRDQAGTRCEFTTKSGARCRFPIGHPDQPDAAPPNVPTHVCIEPQSPKAEHTCRNPLACSCAEKAQRKQAGGAP